MAFLIASDLGKDVAGSPLLRGVSFKLERGERMTLAGRNGAGKTTLLRMLAGEESIDSGELSLAKGVRLALHDQRPPRRAQDGSPVSLREYVLSGCASELALERELGELERQMAADPSDQGALDRYAALQARFETVGGYLWRDRAAGALRGLGFGEADMERPLTSISGGQLTRASLARVLATGADVLLLDEPTNHLDIESLEWLEQTLVASEAAVVLVAHDRWFLEAVGTSVLELYRGRDSGGRRGGPAAGVSKARFFAGPWHAWRREQAAREIASGKAIAAHRAEIARMERFAERFRSKATKARQVQSRLKRIAKAQEQAPDDPSGGFAERGLEFAFKPAERSGRVVFELQDGRIEIGDPPRVLLEGAELWLERGEHVALVGPNATGKTTLVETLVGRRPLAAGRLSTGHNVTVGHLSQHSDELGVGGGPGQSALDAVQRATGLTPNKARALLGRFLFSGLEAEKPLDSLSGGERQRLALAVLVNGAPEPPNVLILDEPTNHLDVESREALEDALRSFGGAVLLVSHDRALLDAVGTRTIAIEDGTLVSHLGGWPEYVRDRDERRQLEAAGAVQAGAAQTGETQAGEEPAGRASSGSGAGRSRGLSGGGGAGKRRSGGRAAAGAHRGGATGSARGTGGSRAAAGGRKGGRGVGRGSAGGGNHVPAEPSKNRLREQAKAERAVEEAEEALRALEDELADPAAWATKYETAKSEARHTAAKRAVEEAYGRLGELVG